MDYVDRVPCSDEVSHTGFGIIVNEIVENEVLVNFFPYGNFQLADVAWRRDFTDSVTDQLRDIYPGKAVVFCIDRC